MDAARCGQDLLGSGQRCLGVLQPSFESRWHGETGWDLYSNPIKSCFCIVYCAVEASLKNPQTCSQRSSTVDILHDNHYQSLAASFKLVYSVLIICAVLSSLLNMSKQMRCRCFGGCA